MSINWDQHIQIDSTWVDKHLNRHLENPLKGKIKLRGYTIKASGTTISAQAIANALHLMLPEYVFSKEQLAEHGDRKALSLAQKYFGAKDPKADGKYGELLLFALVESILGAKMVAHKIKALSNFNDQVKGGDGIFLGSYLIADGSKYPACFLGESKVVSKYSDGLNDAFDSIERFHSEDTTHQFLATEYIVAKENLIIDDDIDLNELYDRLNPSSDAFNEQIMVHPILLMYNAAKIKTFERKCTTKDNLENLIKAEVLRKVTVYEKSILEKLQKYPDIARVYLDFFIIPTNSVDDFRNSLYYHIHGVPYPQNA